MIHGLRHCVRCDGVHYLLNGFEERLATDNNYTNNNYTKKWRLVGYLPYVGLGFVHSFKSTVPTEYGIVVVVHKL